MKIKIQNFTGNGKPSLHGLYRRILGYHAVDKGISNFTNCLSPGSNSPNLNNNLKNSYTTSALSASTRDALFQIICLKSFP